MKCKYCGAAVTLQDEFCPYCGALNEPARKHIADMKKYSADYEETKTEVLENAHKQSITHAKIITLVLMAVAVVIMFVLNANVSDMVYYIEDMQNAAHASEHAAALAEYEGNGEYALLYAYYTEHNNWNSNEISQYDAVAMMANYYQKILDEVYCLSSGTENYRTQSGSLQYIAQCISGFYETYNMKDSTYRPERYTEAHLEAMEDMEDKMFAILKSYMSLTDEDLAALSETEDSDILIMLGRRTGYYE